MLDRKRATFDWLDILWLLFLLALALLPPIHEIHKQFILLAIGVFQLLEGRLVAWLPQPPRPPIHEIHNQFILLAIGVFQLLEGRLVAWLPKRGPAYSVVIKILLATL